MDLHCWMRTLESGALHRLASEHDVASLARTLYGWYTADHRQLEAEAVYPLVASCAPALCRSGDRSLLTTIANRRSFPTVMREIRDTVGAAGRVDEAEAVDLALERYWALMEREGPAAWPVSRGVGR